MPGILSKGPLQAPKDPEKEALKRKVRSLQNELSMLRSVWRGGQILRIDYSYGDMLTEWRKEHPVR